MGSQEEPLRQRNRESTEHMDTKGKSESGMRSGMRDDDKKASSAVCGQCGRVVQGGRGERNSCHKITKANLRRWVKCTHKGQLAHTGWCTPLTAVVVRVTLVVEVRGHSQGDKGHSQDPVCQIRTACQTHSSRWNERLAPARALSPAKRDL